MTATVHSILVARRSIHISAPPVRVWEEFSTFERMSRWWSSCITASTTPAAVPATSTPATRAGGG
jgi:uncharacterized protein YndB with AHSA1/START domain